MISKGIELSIIIALIAIPARAARQKNPKVGLRKMIISMLVFEVFYWFSIRFLHGRF